MGNSASVLSQTPVLCSSSEAGTAPAPVPVPAPVLTQAGTNNSKGANAGETLLAMLHGGPDAGTNNSEVANGGETLLAMLRGGPDAGTTSSEMAKDSEALLAMLRWQTMPAAFATSGLEVDTHKVCVCGNRFLPDDAFCDKCGVKLPEPKADPEADMLSWAQ